MRQGLMGGRARGMPVPPQVWQAVGGTLLNGLEVGDLPELPGETGAGVQALIQASLRTNPTYHLLLSVSGRGANLVTAQIDVTDLGTWQIQLPPLSTISFAVFDALGNLTTGGARDYVRISAEFLGDV